MSGDDEQRLHGHVVAGTGDTSAARSAVRHAAREADARRVVLELVHVLPREASGTASEGSAAAWAVERLEESTSSPGRPMRSSWRSERPRPG